MALLSYFDLGLAALLLIALALLNLKMAIGLEKALLINALRSTVQLSLIGLVLHHLFAHANIFYLLIIATIMISVAGYEIGSRLSNRLKGPVNFSISAGSMFLSSFTITLFALILILRQDPWYHPQYAIPFLGMLLGNTMNGIALGLNHFYKQVVEQHEKIEQRLMLGHTSSEACQLIRRDSARAGMIPSINAMAVAGLVSLPGMMTGQILAGSPPMEAVKYQILIIFLIVSGSGFGIVFALHFANRFLFDDRERLRLERIVQRS